MKPANNIATLLGWLVASRCDVADIGSIQLKQATTPPGTVYGLPVFQKQSQTTEDIIDRIINARNNTATAVSEGNAAAGNYRKGRFNYHGLKISIENPKDSYRSGTDDSGKKWASLMKFDYGYIRGTTGADGDPVDVFIGDDPKSELVFIINQNTKGGDFDEHKVILGVLDAKQARQTYSANYNDGWTGCGGVVGMTMPQFKQWLADADKESPAGEVKQAGIPEPLQGFVDYFDAMMTKEAGKFTGLIKALAPATKGIAQSAAVKAPAVAKQFIRPTVKPNPALVAKNIPKPPVVTPSVPAPRPQPAARSSRLQIQPDARAAIAAAPAKVRSVRDTIANVPAGERFGQRPIANTVRAATLDGVPGMRRLNQAAIATGTYAAGKGIQSANQSVNDSIDQTATGMGQYFESPPEQVAGFKQDMRSAKWPMVVDQTLGRAGRAIGGLVGQQPTRATQEDAALKEMALEGVRRSIHTPPTQQPSLLKQIIGYRSPVAAAVTEASTVLQRMVNKPSNIGLTQRLVDHIQRRGVDYTDPAAIDNEIRSYMGVTYDRLTPAQKQKIQQDATTAAAGAAAMMGMKQGGVNTTLQPHQQRVVDKIQQDDQPGLVVAHGVGSGKSLTAIASQEALGLPSSVVLPAALKANYKKEQIKHTAGEHQPTDISSLEVAARSGEVPDNPMLIVDEAHRLRSPGTKSNDALKKNTAEKRLLLTGSPFYNHPSDISELVNIASGEDTLPVSREAFTQKYITDEYVQPSLIDKYIRGIKPGVVTHLDPWRRRQLGKILGKWVDYHPNSQTDFPEVTREDVDVEMTPKQMRVYDTVLGKAPWWVAAKIRNGLPPNKQEAKTLNEFMGGVRQVSNSTRAFERPGRTSEEPKIQRAFEELQKTLDGNPRAKAVVYSNWLNSGINPYKERLQAAGIPFGEFTGAMGKKQRDEMVQQYNGNKLRALLLSSAGGEGLDLKGTRLLQMLDPHWNSEKLKQVEGRGIRYRSHADLPEEERNIKIQRFFATRPRSGILERLGLGTPDMAADRYLAQMAANKSRLNDEFRELLVENSGV